MYTVQKKITIIASFYAVSLTALTWVIVYFLPYKHVIYSLPYFYVLSLFLAFIVSYFLFFSNIVDIEKGRRIVSPSGRDITKRKVLLVSFIYSVFFILMFIYSQVSIVTFALWPVMIFICLLLLFDRRLIFNIKDKEMSPQRAQKYGIRILMTISVFASMTYLQQFIQSKTLPMQSDLLIGWELIDISIWCLPIALVSSLVIADWITALILHSKDKDFLKHTDTVLFLGTQILVIIFLLII
ncbi:hypothetical protein HGB13_01020 [bacterium]|nr:hypothetical protein [bacterium]